MTANYRAWRCDVTDNDRNPGWLVWDGTRMWWKTDGRHWTKPRIVTTPEKAASDPDLVEADPQMAATLGCSIEANARGAATS